MIDWHSHILPAMDDGSRDVAESLAMLRSMAEQGVDTVVATPHFYANHESSAESFLERRQRAEARLREGMASLSNAPRLVCGAEVRYYPGIRHMSGLEQLTIGSSRLLLLEMPFNKWTEYTVRELLEMLSDDRFTVLLAHIERYWKLQDRRTLDRLLENDLHMQINTSCLMHFATRRKALNLLQNKHVRFIGSDAHNITSRPPHIHEAYAILRKKLGDGFVAGLDAFGHRALGET